MNPKVLVAVAALGVAGGAHGQCAPEWDTAPSSPLGVSVSVRGSAVHEGMFHIGGPYTGPSGVENVVARWDGTDWTALGSFPPSSRVNALASFDGELYVGGGFTIGSAVNVARWDGAAWVAAGAGPGGQVGAMRALTFAGQTKLYVGVFFGGLMTWDGAAWVRVGDLGGSVNDVIVWDDGAGETLFATGNALTIDGAPINAIARYNGTAWEELGDGSGLTGGLGRGITLAVFDDGSGEALYVGGNFEFAGGAEALYIAKWDGSGWSPVGAGFDASVLDLEVVDFGGGPTLYAGGNFFFSGGTLVNLIAELDPGEGWTGLGAGLSGGTVPSVSKMALLDDADGKWLYAAGGFTDVAGAPAPTVARWGCADSGCYADCDGSGSLDFFDFLCFQDAFGTGDPYADCDGSGSLDFFDFLCYQNEFAAGCP
ncbi:MAG: hypothetical protein ACF8R7_11170 [Phycisphaerales bacterium JB039]